MPGESELWNASNQPKLRDVRAHLPGSKTNSCYSQCNKKSIHKFSSGPARMGFTYVVCKTVRGKANYAVEE